MVKQNKKAAIEMSMTTIVILVLAMSMLILGLVLIKAIFTGAKYNVDTMNKKVEAEIGKLFVEDKRMVVYLANQEAEMSQGKDYGVAFGIRNLIKGVGGISKFKYDTDINSPTDVKKNCGGLSSKEALSWIKAGKSGELGILSGNTKSEIIKFSIPEGAPLCIIRYTIDVKDPVNTGQDYDSMNFDVNIKA